MGAMTRDGTGDTVRLEPRTMRLLLCLAEHAGQVVSAEQLLDEVWPGVVVSPDSVYQAIASLRRLLGDDPKQPSYIMTVPRKGYRMVAAVETAVDSLPAPTVVGAKPTWPRRRRLVLAACAGLAVLTGAASWAYLHGGHAPPRQSVAVLPFLDLTEEMKEEYFADGITEELIGRFSRIRGFHVPSPTASFYYKGKQISVADFARKLDVSYVLDGSVRKSGDTVRIAARLMKADKGFVIWSATYDRPVGDLLMVQDDIGEQVTRALQAAIDDENAPPGKATASR